MPPEYWAELIGGGGDSEDEDDNGPSVESDPNAYASNTQDLLDLDPDTGIDTAAPSDDYDDDEEEEIDIDEDKKIFRETEFATLALGGEDPAHKAIESIREPADDEYEEDEDANGIVVIKKRSELKGNAEIEGKLPVLDPRVADNLTGSFATIMLRYVSSILLLYSDLADDSFSAWMRM